MNERELAILVSKIMTKWSGRINVLQLRELRNDLWQVSNASREMGLLSIDEQVDEAIDRMGVLLDEDDYGRS